LVLLPLGAYHLRSISDDALLWDRGRVAGLLAIGVERVTVDEALHGALLVGLGTVADAGGR